MDDEFIYRVARAEDAEQILAIYAPYIENTSYTFETDVPSVGDFAERIGQYLENWPWLVCELDGKIAGYAYASRYRERTGYQWCVECSIYMHDQFRQKGIGRQLYNKLIAVLKQQGFRNLYAVINTPNDVSISFHESCGFQFFAMYENVGWKLGKWKNVGWWRLILNEYDDVPSPPILFASLNKDFFGEIGLLG